MLDVAHQTFDHDDVTVFALPEIAVARPVVIAERHAQAADFEFPRWVWGTMSVAYAAFFAGILAGTGHDLEARFMIVISLFYTAMFFGTARLLTRVRPVNRLSGFARGIAPLQTLTGPMPATAVAAQVLVVPLCLALFGLAIAIIRVAVF